MKIFNKGQVVIPSSLRKKYNLKIGDMIDVVPEDNAIRLVPKKMERLADKLFGVFAQYRKDKSQLTEQLIQKVTEQGFVEEWRDEVR